MHHLFANHNTFSKEFPSRKDILFIIRENMPDTVAKLTKSGVRHHLQLATNVTTRAVIGASIKELNMKA